MKNLYGMLFGAMIRPSTCIDCKFKKPRRTTMCAKYRMKPESAVAGNGCKYYEKKIADNQDE